MQYLSKFGAFRESGDGAGREPHRTDLPGLAEIVRPVARKGPAHLARAVRHVERHGDARRAPGAAEQPADILRFARQLVALHRAMLPYYVQMRYLTPREKDHFDRHPAPVTGPLLGRAAWTERTLDEEALEDEAGAAGDMARAPSGELEEQLLHAFALNIHLALCCRARSELFETLERQGTAAARVAVRSAAAASFRGGDAGGGASLAGRFLTGRVLVKGRRVRYAVADPALASMLASLDEKPFPALVRWLAAFKTAVSTMITAMPVFIVKNFFRDTLAGFVAGRHPTVPFLGTLAGGVEAVREMVSGESADLRAYLLQGGFYSGLVESETHLSDAPQGSRARRTNAALRRLWRRFAHAVTRPAWVSEAGTRVDQYRRAIRAGATPYAASRAARMVSSDFANIGSSRMWRMYVHTVPFLNAALQGLDQLYQICRRPRRSSPAVPPRSREQRAHMRKMARSGGWLAAMSCAVWLFNGSTEARRDAYHAETDYEKASWVTFYDVRGDADVRIPVPFQIGAAFIKLPEVVFDLAGRRETLAGPKFVWSLVHGNLSVGVVPAVLQPWVDIYRNRNFFGNEIIPAYMANWAPEDQYFDRSTPLPYRTAGAALNASPFHVQTVWRAWTGHLGNLAATALDEVMWDAGEHGPKPFPRTARLVTGVYGLQPPRPRTNTRYSNEFYDISDWADGRARSVSCRAAARVPAACLARTLAGRASREASQLRREGDDIRTDRGRSRQAKERELDAVYAEVNAVLRDALPELRRLRRLDLEAVDAGRPSADPSDERPQDRRPRQEAVPPAPPAPRTPAGHQRPCPAGTIDVNSAGLAELDRIPGIGPALAQRIVDERVANGRFGSYLELQRVRGIGPRTVERMREAACAG